MQVLDQDMASISRQLPYAATCTSMCSMPRMSYDYVATHPPIPGGSDPAMGSSMHCTAGDDVVAWWIASGVPRSGSIRFHHGSRWRRGCGRPTGHVGMLNRKLAELRNVYHRHSHVDARGLCDLLRIEQQRRRRDTTRTRIANRGTRRHVQVHWGELRLCNDSGCHRGYHPSCSSEFGIRPNTPGSGWSSKRSVVHQRDTTVVPRAGRSEHCMSNGQRGKRHMRIPLSGVRSLRVRQSRNVSGTGSIRRLASIVLVIAALGFSVGMMHVPMARAASAGRISIAPPIVSHTVAAGSSVSGTMKLRLISEGSARLSITTEPVRPGDESSFAAPDATEDAPTSWIIPAYSTQTITSGQTLQLGYRVQVPRNATPGAHACAILVAQTARVAGTNTDARSGVATTGAVGAVVVVTVPGDLRYSIATRRIRSPRWIWSGDSARFDIRLANTGNTMITPSTVFHSGSFAGVADQRITTRPLPILPRGQRTISIRWNDAPLVGWFHPRVFVTAPSVDQTVITYPTVVVLPPRWLIALIVLAIVSPIAAHMVRRRRSRQES